MTPASAIRHILDDARATALYQHLLYGDVDAFAKVFALSKRGPYHSIAATYLEAGCDYRDLDSFSFRPTFALIETALQSLLADIPRISCIGSFELHLAGSVSEQGAVLGFFPEVRLVMAGASREVITKVFPREHRVSSIDKHQVGAEVEKALKPAAGFMLTCNEQSLHIPLVGQARLRYERWRSAHPSESGILIYERDPGKTGLEFIPPEQLVDLDEAILEQLEKLKRDS